LEKKEDNLTFFNKHVKERLSVITFKEKDNFNYRINNYRNIAIKTSSKSSTNILNQTNIIVVTAKASKKRSRPLKVVFLIVKM
jgi:hypothetical protein